MVRLIILSLYFSLALLTGLCSILLLRAIASSPKTRHCFLLLYTVYSVGLYLITSKFGISIEFLVQPLLIPFVFVAGYALGKQFEKPWCAYTFMILGFLWALISSVPYLLMFGGYVELPLILRILTFPVWITVQLSDFCWGIPLTILENLHIPRYYDLFSSIFLPIIQFITPIFTGSGIALLIYYIYSSLLHKWKRNSKNN